MSWLFHLIDQFGYLVLFISLMLELIIVPIPNEILMSYVGFLVYQHKLNLYLTILFGGLGGIVGVSISYWIGYKLGKPFFNKYGSKIHMGPDKIEKIAKWNKKYGKGLLLFSYFIPGVRHITSIFSGITRIPFKTFAIFAYIGVFIWVGTFISLGNIFGPKWESFHNEAKVYVTLACIGIGIIYLAYYLIKTNRKKIKENILLLIENTFNRFNSFLKTKLVIFGALIAFIGLIFLIVGMIQDFIANEFEQFNSITNTIIMYAFNERWKPVMTLFNSMSNWKVLLIFILFTAVWISVKGGIKRIEFLYFFLSILGAVFLGKGLNILFHYVTHGKELFSQSFPNEQALSCSIIYSFFMYEIIRHSKSTLLNLLTFLIVIFILLAIAASEIYLGIHVPSDFAAGYAFGGVWVCFMILLLEVSRLIKLIKETDFSKQPK
ncbi:VTT domain-containing protein [Heyndrickxia sporothermodurans]|uniref:VTT domain-containing protein n=1 Tax=Heyndrickxia sporothermodurans TaxID=46224 RepID=UPI002DB7EA3A|nr:VTT domain-containing protein [Heyndrickxia sporothermodurans]MEB6549608.1 VTT domain-containing protein [Heyndrickxia sporothermodurans]